MYPVAMPKKIFASTLSALFFLTNAVFLHAAETNIWNERQKNMRQPIQLAALPDAFRGLPDLNHVLESIPSIPRTSGLKLSPSEAAFVDALPMDACQIKNVYVNPLAKSIPLLFLIQDVHMNFEAQQNISRVLLALNNQAARVSVSKPLLVGVEGAFGPFDFTRFRAFDDKNLVKAVSDYFLKENKFAAPSFVGITAETPATTFYGIDDTAHYKANVEAYRDSQTLKPTLVAEIEKSKRALIELKTKELNPELKKFDAAQSAYFDGTKGLGDFIAYLSYTSEATGNPEAGSELVIEQFLAAYEIEKSLDFKKVERERAQVVEKLAAKLNPDEIKQLVAEGLAYRTGKISFAGYYKAIKSLIDRHGISLATAPAFDQYIRYVLLSDGIQAEPLMTSVERLRTQVMSALIHTPREKDLMAQTRQLYLVGKLLDFALTPEEWNEYKSVIPAKAGIQVSNTALKKADGVDSRLRGNDDLKSFERFYCEADIRSEKMVANLLAQSPNSKQALALVVGGFHTPGLTHILKEQGISYAVIQPKITKIDAASGTEYLSIFTREKTPLDKLFEGEKLFLAPNGVAVGNNATLSSRTTTNEAEAVILTGAVIRGEKLPRYLSCRKVGNMFQI